MIYRIAVCDDDNDFLLTMSNIIKDYFSKNRENEYELTTFDNASDLLDNPHMFDIIFLDIEMPNVDGLSAKKALETNKFIGTIVFVSDYDQYMNEAFGKNVIAYIPKNKLNRIAETLKYIDENENRDKILRIATSSIRLYDIFYIESNYGYCTIYTETDSFLFSINLIDIFQRMNSKNFMIVHRSFIVHFKYIKSFSSGEITLADDRVVKLSRKYREDFKNRYLNYLKEG